MYKPPKLPQAKKEAVTKQAKLPQAKKRAMTKQAKLPQAKKEAVTKQAKLPRQKREQSANLQSFPAKRSRVQTYKSQNYNFTWLRGNKSLFLLNRFSFKRISQRFCKN